MINLGQFNIVELADFNHHIQNTPYINNCTTCEYPPIYHQALVKDQKITVKSLKYYNAYVKFKTCVISNSIDIHGLKSVYEKISSERDLNIFRERICKIDNTNNYSKDFKAIFHSIRDEVNDEILEILPKYFHAQYKTEYSDFLNHKFRLNTPQINAIHRTNLCYKQNLILELERTKT